MEPSKTQLNNNQSLLIREAQVNDASQLLEFVKRAGSESDFLSFGEGEFELTVSEEEEFLRKIHLSDNNIFLLGLIENEIVATLHFAGGRRPRTRHAGELGMSVAKKYWGSGIGSLMIDTLMKWAKGEGIITKINLRVREDNKRAINLYTYKGFKKEGTIRREIYLNGKYYDTYWMGLLLD